MFHKILFTGYLIVVLEGHDRHLVIVLEGRDRHGENYSRTSMARTRWDHENMFETRVVRAIEGL